jgi:hypothetical protein
MGNVAPLVSKRQPLPSPAEIILRAVNMLKRRRLAAATLLSYSPPFIMMMILPLTAKIRNPFRDSGPEEAAG